MISYKVQSILYIFFGSVIVFLALGDLMLRILFAGLGFMLIYQGLRLQRLPIFSFFNRNTFYQRWD